VFQGHATPGGVDQTAIENWGWVYASLPAILAVNPDATRQLLNVTKAAVDPGNTATVAQTVLGILWYDIFATNDAMSKLDGQPFDNSWRWYSGSSNDWALNRKIARFKASSTALRNIEAYYQTTGSLTRPLVTMHTTSDPIVPYWHESLYWWKALLHGSGWLHTNIPVFKYGHCSFSDQELLAGFGLLVFKVAVW